MMRVPTASNASTFAGVDDDDDDDDEDILRTVRRLSVAISIRPHWDLIPDI